MLFNGGVLVQLLYNGELCDQFVAPEVKRLGAHFVCGFIETFASFWLVIGSGIHGYYIFVVMQAATLVRESHLFPELLKKAEQLPRAPAVPQQGYMGAPRQFGPPASQ